MDNKMPFLFAVTDNPDGHVTHYIVMVAHFDMTTYDARWMDCKELPPHRVLVPDVDIATEIHRFDTEIQAKTFIRDWWRENG